MQSEFQVYYFNGMTTVEQQTLIKNAHPEVRSFWETYAHSLRFILENGYPAISKRSIGNRKTVYSGKETSFAFFNLFKKEKTWVKVQEIIDPSSESKYVGYLLNKYRTNQEMYSQKSVAENMQKAIGNKSILERIKESKSTTVAIKRPLFAQTLPNWYEEDKQKWYEFTTEEQLEILDAPKKSLNIFQQQDLEKYTQKRWNRYLQNFANQIFGPFFYWTEVSDTLVPQWNVFAPKQAKALNDAFLENQEEEIKERKRLNKTIQYLYTKKTLVDTQK